LLCQKLLAEFQQKVAACQWQVGLFFFLIKKKNLHPEASIKCLYNPTVLHFAFKPYSASYQGKICGVENIGARN
jgi:hypothetical protein